MIKEKNFISAVIYIHNSECDIDTFLNNLIDIFETDFEHSEIICVNDRSEDNSTEVIRRISKKAQSTSISILNMSYFHGLEAAMNAGMDLAIGDFVYEFDSAVQDFDAAEIMRVYRRSLQGYDIVSCSPDRRQRISSRLFYYIFDHFTDLNYSMNTERFRILSRRVINRISSMNRTVPYRKAVYANCGLQVDNLRYRVTLQNSNRIRDKREKKYRRALAVDSLILFTEIGYRFAITMTSIMILTTIFMAVYSMTIYLIGTPVAGWTTTILFLSFCFFGLFGILTIVIKYLQIVVNLVFKRKRYNFESIEKLTR